MQNSKPTQYGFTLVELSIVLVILGLLVGGVLTGQSLIRAAELRSVSTQYQGYITAIQTFRDKYFALPGDMTNAQSYWGIADASGSTCFTTASTDSKTCNGDGNGMIMPNTGTSNEPFRFWQHLANAGLIEGSYDGVQHGVNPFTYSSTTAANAPRGKIGSSLWFVWNWGTAISNSAPWFDGEYGNRLGLGGPMVNSEPGAAIFKAEDIYNIDMKMDDGKPATGKVLGQMGCTNATGSADKAALYDLTNSAVTCNINFPRAF